MNCGVAYQKYRSSIAPVAWSSKSFSDSSIKFVM